MREAREALGIVAAVVGLALLAYVNFQRTSLNQIQEPPILFYTRMSCMYAEPCSTVYGEAQFRLSIANQAAVGLLSESGREIIPIPLRNCSIWDKDNWTCDTSYFRDHVGRKNGEWHFGDRTLVVMPGR